jgi:Repeat of unknown function (DUF5907)
MKKLILLITLTISLFNAFAQKKGLNYQAVILDPKTIEVPGVNVTGQPLSNGKVWVRFTLKTSAGVDYEEIQQTTTDEFGLISLTVGTGTSTASSSNNATGISKYSTFDSIVWDSEMKLLVVAVNFDGGTKFTTVSNQPLNFTPYALYAESVDYKNVRDTPKNLSQFNNDSGYLVPKDLDPLKTNIASNTQAIADNQATNEGKFLVVNQTIEALDKKVKSDITNINNTLTDHDNRINTTANNLTNTANNLNSQIGSVRNLTEANTNTLNNLNQTYEPAANKSAATDLGGGNPSDALFPTQRAAKTYVDNAVSIAVASGAPDATTLASGKVQLTGDLGGTATNPTVPGLATKESLSNKSTNVTADASSDTKYPSVRAIKTYVDQATQGIALQAAVDAKADKNSPIFTGTPSLPSGTTGVTQSPANNSTALATTAFVQGAIASATIVDADATTKGKIQLAGDLGGTAASPTVPALANKENVSNKSTATALGTSDQLYPTQNAVKTYVDNQVASATIADATSLVKGKIQLAGDLTGTASAPTIAASAVTSAKIADGTIATADIADNAITTAKITDANVTDAKIATVSGSKVTGNISGNAANVTGTVAILNGGTGATTAAGALTNLGAQSAANLSTDLSADAASLTKYPAVKSIKDYVDNSVAAATIADATTTLKGKIQLGGDLAGTGTTAAAPVISDNAITTVKINAAAITTAKIADANVTTAKLVDDAVTTIKITDANVTSAKIAPNAIITSKVADGAITNAKIADATILNAKLGEAVSIANGGTGATTAAAALTALGAQSTANLSTNLTTDAASLTKYPAVKTVKDYIDASVVAATPDATTSVKGKIQLGGDLAGTGTTAAAPVISDNAITTVKITDANVTTAKLADNAVTTVKITDANVTTAKLADNAVTTAKITDANVTTAKLASSAVTTAKIADANITTTKLADTTVTTAKIANSAITNAKIGETITIANGGTGATTASAALTALGAQSTANLSTNLTTDAASLTKYPAVKTVKDYVDASVVAATPDATTSVKGKIQLGGDLAGTGTTAAAPVISDNAITTVKITDANVTTAKLADNAVTTVKITDANVTAAKLADNAVTTAKITDANVTTAKLASSAVTTAKIADANVTTAKLADTTVTTAKIANSAITNAKIGETITIANGGTGATTAAAALTALGAQSTANLSTNVTTDAASLTKYPAVKTIKDYVDASISSGAPDADATTKGKIQLAGDLTGTAASPAIAANAVTASKINDGAVTSAKIADGTIVNADINASAAIADTKLATISTAGKVSNSATTATNANTASTIVARDASGNFTAGTITADLTGLASKATNINGGTVGAIPYQSAANTTTLLSGNSSATKKFLTQTGDGSAAAAPVWAGVAVSDITGTLPVANGGTGVTTVAANLVFAGPTSGATASAPSFRSLVAADLPAGSTNYVINGTTQQASTDFNISGSGTIGTTLAVTGNTTIGGTATITGATTLSALTASKGVFTDASKRLTSTGTLGTDQGGTGMTSFNSGGAMYATSTSALTTGTLPTSAGGTGLTSYTSGGALYTTSTTAITSGTLPISAGGTGSTTQNFVDLTTAQTIAGAKTFSSTIVGSISGNAATVTNGVYTTDKLNVLALTSSTELASVISNETGSGSLVFATSPTLVTPSLGVASATSVAFAGSTSGTATISAPAVAGTGTAITLPAASGTLATLAGTETLTNKTLTSPTFTAPVLGTPASGTLTNATGLPLTTGVTGVLPLANGGTGASTKAAAFDALSPMTTSGDIIYGGTSGTGTRLAKGTDGQVLTLASGVPSWATPTGINTLAAIGSTPNANGASISGTTLTLQPADGTNGGVVTTSSQTFAGIKTFSNTTNSSSTTTGSVIISGGLGVAKTIYVAEDSYINGLKIGKGLASLTNNIAIGGTTLAAATTGDKNIALGSSALAANTSGSDNVALGYNALAANTVGAGNTAIGSSSLTTMNNATSSNILRNTAVGYETLSAMTAGNYNTVLGTYALDNMTSGSSNVAIGNEAAWKIGTSTTSNTLMNNSVIIGADARTLADNETNAIVIGYQGRGLGSNTAVIGNSSTSITALNGDVLIGTTTDAGAYKLQVTGDTKLTGTLTITGGTPGAGKVLISDANGLASWSANANGGVNSITASATMAATDTYNLIVFSGSTASQTITLPSASAAGAGREITIKNIASVSVGVAATSGALISDSTTSAATSLNIGIEPSNNWIKAISNGTNWIILRALF